MTFRKKQFQGVILLASILMLGACNKEETADTTGELRIVLSDAPVDDPRISGVFVTVSKVYIDNEPWEGLDTKQTIDLTALQNGRVQSLGTANIETKAYQHLALVLSLDTDAADQSPGCYVLTKDGQKHNLAANNASTLSIDIPGPQYMVTDGNTNTIVVDFDLRKALRYGNATDPASAYAFGTNAEMQTALRYVSTEHSGAIEGHCNNLLNTGDEKIIVYAYVKGTFNRQHEVSPTDDRQFPNAVASTVVDAQGHYKISFLGTGDYALIFAAYKEDGADGTLHLQGTMSLKGGQGVDLDTIAVHAGSTVSVDVTLTGLLPLK